MKSGHTKLMLAMGYVMYQYIVIHVLTSKALRYIHRYIDILSHLYLLVLSIATDLQGYTGTYIAAIIRQLQDVKVLGSITCKILSVSLVCLIPGPFNF